MRRAAVLLLVLLALGAAALALPVRDWLLASRRWIADLGPLGPVVAVAGYGPLSLAMVPASLLNVAVGLMFGLGPGLAVVLVGANLGGLEALLLFRFLLRRHAERLARSQPAFAAIDRAVSREGFKVVLLLRLTPLLPFTVLNALLAFTRIAVGPYLAGTFFGILPATLIYVAAGSLGESAAGPAPAVRFWMGVAGVAVTAVAATWLGRLAARALREAVPSATGTGRS